MCILGSGSMRLSESAEEQGAHGSILMYTTDRGVVNFVLSVVLVFLVVFWNQLFLIDSSDKC